MANSLVIGLRILFAALGCVMVFTLTYTLSTDGLPFRKDLLTPWMAATLVDFYINVVPLAVWISYKESNWISATLWYHYMCLHSFTIHEAIDSRIARSHVLCSVATFKQV
ncbi:hypothetical protein Prudu_021370 [Prunus dulcis]|uniref:Uncharacterized protein n=1 Tax=Prunus dulcis TaxID=3755 RepID=A0A4Y1RX71_PRUDU|nr:hypothetical protein Prudu_021370 [Prunus dulcis]